MARARDRPRGVRALGKPGETLNGLIPGASATPDRAVVLRLEPLRFSPHWASILHAFNGKHGAGRYKITEPERGAALQDTGTNSN